MTQQDPRERRVHRSVMVRETVTTLAPKDGAIVLDLTAGAGGHSEAILEATSNGTVIAFDRDPQILELAKRRLERFGDRAQFELANFAQIGAVCARRRIDRVGGVLADLGVSSLQLDDAARGFSFDKDGPLDMRMGTDAKRSAAEFLNRGTREDLLFAIGELGDEPRAKRVVDAILDARKQAPLRRTCELAELVARVLGGGAGRHHHPATRTFQGVRMWINDELGALETALPEALRRLECGGRAVVIAFHGGEDRVVKNIFRDAEAAGDVVVLTSNPIVPSEAEIQANPRARSARLRAAERRQAGG